MPKKTQTSNTNENANQSENNEDTNTESAQSPVTQNFQENKKPVSKKILIIIGTLILLTVLVYGGYLIYNSVIDKGKEVEPPLTEPETGVFYQNLFPKGNSKVATGTRYMKENGTGDMIPTTVRLHVPEKWSFDMTGEGEGECNDYTIKSDDGDATLMIRSVCGEFEDVFLTVTPGMKVEPTNKKPRGVEGNFTLVRYIAEGDDVYHYGVTESVVTADTDFTTIDIYPYLTLKLYPEYEETWMRTFYDFTYTGDEEGKQEAFETVDALVSTVVFVD